MLLTEWAQLAFLHLVSRAKGKLDVMSEMFAQP